MLKKFSITLPFKNICDSSKNIEEMNTVPRELKNRVETIGMHKNDSVTTFTSVIPSIANGPKHIYWGNNCFTGF